MADILAFKRPGDFMEGLFLSEAGLLCRLRIEPFETKVVLPGENTIQCDPVWVEYEDLRGVTRKRLENLKQAQPAKDGVWIINDPVTITAIREDFVDRKLLLRGGLALYEAALAAGEEFCTVLLSEKGE